MWVFRSLVFCVFCLGTLIVSVVWANQLYVAGNNVVQQTMVSNNNNAGVQTAPAGAQNAGNFQSISSQDFLQRVGNALTVHYCDPQSPLLQDFHLTVGQCQMQISKAQQQCAQKLQSQMPAVIGDATTAGHWGQTLGQCIGQAFVQSQSTTQSYS